MASATTGLRRMDSATLAAMSADVLAQGGNPLSFDSIDTYFQNFMTRTQFGERLLEVYLKLSPLADGDDPIEAMKTFSNVLLVRIIAMVLLLIGVVVMMFAALAVGAASALR